MPNIPAEYPEYLLYQLSQILPPTWGKDAMAIIGDPAFQPASAADYREDERLVERVQFGDQGAFRQLFEHYSPLVYRIAYRMLGNPDDASDLTQDVFVRAFQRLTTLKSGMLFKAWITRITVNMVHDQQRRRRITTASLDAPPPGMTEDSEWSLPATDPPTDQRLVSAELAQQIQAALLHLSPDHRTVIILHHLEHQSVEEISATLHVPTGTVKSRLARARADLRRHLDSYLNPEIE